MAASGEAHDQVFSLSAVRELDSLRRPRRDVEEETSLEEWVEGHGPSVTNGDPPREPAHQGLFVVATSSLVVLPAEPIWAVRPARHSCALMNSQVGSQVVLSVPS